MLTMFEVLREVARTTLREPTSLNVLPSAFVAEKLDARFYDESADMLVAHGD